MALNFCCTLITYYELYLTILKTVKMPILHKTASNRVLTTKNSPDPILNMDTAIEIKPTAVYSRKDIKAIFKVKRSTIELLSKKGLLKGVLAGNRYLYLGSDLLKVFAGS